MVDHVINRFLPAADSVNEASILIVVLRCVELPNCVIAVEYLTLEKL